jgi:hypothetical protein
MTFSSSGLSSLGLSADLLRAINERNYPAPTQRRSRVGSSNVADRHFFPQYLAGPPISEARTSPSTIAVQEKRDYKNGNN